MGVLQAGIRSSGPSARARVEQVPCQAHGARNPHVLSLFSNPSACRCRRATVSREQSRVRGLHCRAGADRSGGPAGGPAPPRRRSARATATTRPSGPLVDMPSRANRQQAGDGGAIKVSIWLCGRPCLSHGTDGRGPAPSELGPEPCRAPRRPRADPPEPARSSSRRVARHGFALGRSGRRSGYSTRRQ